jgi:hypothetical protein
VNNEKKAELSKKERRALRFGNDEKMKKYQIFHIVKKQGVTFEEAEEIYNQRVKNLYKRKKKKSSSKKKKGLESINSVYMSLDGITSAKNWKKIK